MRWEDIRKLPREQLLCLLEDSFKNTMRVDGYWFLGLEKRWGREKAVEVDEEVWRRFGSVVAYQVKRANPLPQEPIPALIQALRLMPTWAFNIDLEVEPLSADEAVLWVTRCRSQSERIEQGLGVFPCRGVEEAFFAEFARLVNPRIKVYCHFCPPQAPKEGRWCQWHFRLEG